MMKFVFRKMLALGLLAALSATAGMKTATAARSPHNTMSVVRTADGDVGDGTSPIKKG